MLADALLDPSSRGDIVIDPFLGSGSTLIAADKIGHVSRGVDLDSLYIDVIIRFPQIRARVSGRAIPFPKGEVQAPRIPQRIVVWSAI
jgi:DNA modification methylase